MTTKSVTPSTRSSSLINILSLVFLILTVIMLILAIYYYRLYVECNSYPSPYCYNDWKCARADEDCPADIIYPYQGLSTVLQPCQVNSNDFDCTKCGNALPGYNPPPNLVCGAQ